MHSVVIRALLCLIVTSVGTLAHAAEVPADCHCPEPKIYSREPTAQVVALFTAARVGDETSFDRLVNEIAALDEYAIEGKPLISYLLWPSPDFITAQRDLEPRTSEDLARIREQHASTLPAKTRMLKRALEHGASAVDASMEAPLPPLHLALVFGTPEMVKLLLAAGADPNQRGGTDNQTPIEFALGDGMFQRMSALPRLVDREQLSQMLLQLLQAGATRPFAIADEYLAEQSDGTIDRPAADYLLWPALAELTSGSEILEAFTRTGTSPALDPQSTSALAHAARAGNLAAVKWLKQQLPRTMPIEDPIHDGTMELDLWLNAAIWALHPDPREPSRTDAILDELLVKEMPWEQGHSGYYMGLSAFRYPEVPSSIGGETLLHHLVELRRADWLRRLHAWGVPMDASSGTTALTEAVRNVDLEMARLLLELGADPMAGERLDDSPLFVALHPYENDLDTHIVNPELVRLLVANLRPDQRARLDEQPPIAKLLHNTPVDAQLVRELVGAGLKPRFLDGSAIAGAIRADDATLIGDLLDAGIKIKERQPSADSLVPTDASTLLSAIAWYRIDLLPRLILAGADPNHVDSSGMTPVNAAILSGDLAVLESLITSGGRLADRPATFTYSRLTPLDYAVASGNLDMLKRIQAQSESSLASTCLRETELLLRTVIHSEDSYWRELEALGFTNAEVRNRECADAEPIAQRLMLALLHMPEELQIGWRFERLAHRLRSLNPSRTQLDAIVPEYELSLIAVAQRSARPDLMAALIGAGATPLDPPSTRPASNGDKRIQKQLVGHYYLHGVTEVGSEILLRADGRFQYMLAYGAFDETAAGTWQVRGGKVMLESESSGAPAGSPYEVLNVAQGTSDDIVIRASDPIGPASETWITALGCTTGEAAHGALESGRWNGQIEGPLCHFIFNNPHVNGGRAFAYEIPPAQRAQREFELVVDANVQPPPSFSTELTIEGDELVIALGGRPMRYRRH